MGDPRTQVCCPLLTDIALETNRIVEREGHLRQIGFNLGREKKEWNGSKGLEILQLKDGGC